jgi:predicted nucleic acid-binding protein
MIPRVYIDTSVIGGCLDEEFREHSERLFADFETERLRAVVSNITIAEILEAPEQVRALLDRPALQKAQTVFLDEEAVSLAEAYIKERVVGEGNRVDAQHIAIATVQRVDILVSWNFQHIVKWSRIRAFNSVNLKYGYPQLEIRSPQEVYYEER